MVLSAKKKFSSTDPKVSHKPRILLEGVGVEYLDQFRQIYEEDFNQFKNRLGCGTYGAESPRLEGEAIGDGVRWS